MKTKNQFQTIPVSFIVESPSNPRKRFDEEALQELANSIKEQGVIQPIVVREFEDRFEIVCGARRWRASQIAGLTEIPAIVRELSDAQAFELQITENLQRQDVHPLDEAEAICIMKERGYTTAEVAERLGKSESFVLRRAKLNDLVEEFKEMFLADKITFTQAKLLSRMSPETQLGIFEEDCQGWKENTAWEPDDLNIEYYINNKKLSTATFDITDTGLLSDVGACTTCPFNTSANRLLFPEMDGEAKCTNSPCYERKQAASFEIQLKKATEDSTLVPVIWSSYSWKQDTKTQAVLKNLGLPEPLEVGRDCEAVTPPSPPDEPISVEDRMQDWDETEEDAKANYEEELEDYKSDMEDYEAELKEYNTLASDPNALKGIFVSDHKRGQIVFIKIKSNSKNAASSVASVVAKGDPNAEQIEAAKIELSGVESREKRAKELDAEKIHRIIVNKLKEQAQYSGNEGELYETEIKALGYFLFTQAEYEVKEKIRKQYKISHSDQYSGNKEASIIVANMTDEMFGMLARSAMMKAWEASASDLHNGGKALRTIADFDYGMEVNSEKITEEYQATVQKRLTKYEERKAALKKKIADLSKPAEDEKPKKGKGKATKKVEKGGAE